MLQKDYFILYLQESSNLELSLLRTLQHVSRLGQALEGKVGVPGRGDAMSKGMEWGAGSSARLGTLSWWPRGDFGGGQEGPLRVAW